MQTFIILISVINIIYCNLLWEISIAELVLFQVINVLQSCKICQARLQENVPKVMRLLLTANDN